MSSTAREASEAETQGSQSSEGGVIPSHPVEFNDSDLEGASRSVSPEPLAQKRGASHLGTTQGEDSRSAAHNSPYPEGYSADGIPPEIHPEIQSVILTDKVTPAERVAATSPAAETHVSSEPAGATTHHLSQGHTPSSVKDSVPATTDQGIADVSTGAAQSAGGAYDTEGAAAYKTEGAAQPSTPSSQSQSSGFFSRILGGLMPASNQNPSTEGNLTTRTSNFSSQPLSASWGQAAPTEPVEQIRQAGSSRAQETGLDEPTATKQAGLEGTAGGGNSTGKTSTAVAAAESLADTKADHEHDTAAASLHTPRSQGRSESEYYGTPQASPDQGRYAGDNSNRSPDKSSLGTGSAQPAHSSTHVEPQYAQPYSGSGTASYHDRNRQLDRDLNQTASFQTAHSTDDHTRGQEDQPGMLGTVLGAVGLDGSDTTGGARIESANTQRASNPTTQKSEPEQTSSPGVLGSVLGAVGLDGSDSTAPSQPAAHSQGGSTQGNQGVLSSIKEAVGFGNNTGSSAGRWDRPAWATAGTTAGPTAGTGNTSRDSPTSAQQGSYGQSYGSGTSAGVSSAAGQGYSSQQPSAQEHKYGQPYEQSDTYKQLSQGNRQNEPASQYGSSQTGYSESAQTVRPDQGAGLASQVKAAIGSSNTSGTGAQGASQNRQYDEPTGQYGSNAGGASGVQSATQPAQDSGRLESNNQYNSSDREYSSSSTGQGTGVVDKLKTAVGIANEPSTHAGFSSSTNPVYGSDSPRSALGGGVGPTLQPTRSRLSNAPPSASWGNTKFTSYEPAESTTQGGYSGGGGGYSGGAGGKDAYNAPAVVSTGGYQGSSAAQDSSARPESPVKRAVSQFEGRATGERPGASHTASTGNYQGTTPEQETKAKLSTESPVKKAVSEYEGRAVGDRPHGAGATGSPGAGAATATGAAATAAASSGQQKPSIQGKTPVEESSQAFTEDTPSATQLGTGGAATSETAQPKLGTTAGEHASVRSPGSPTGRSTAAAAGTDSTVQSGAGLGQAGQGRAPPSFGTTAAEHALSRTSGQPLSRVSGSPSSPPTSFRKSLGANPNDTSALPESTRTTADLPVSTNAPPASARTTQESPAEAATASSAAASKTSQPGTISEAAVDGQKGVPPVGKPATESTKPTTVVNKAAADGKQVGGGSGAASAGIGSKQAAPSPTAGVATQRPAAAANTSSAGVKKPNKGIANCFACFGAAAKE